MKRKFLLLICLFIGVITAQSQEYLNMIDEGTFSVQEIIDNAENYFADRDKGKGTGYVQFKRWEYNAVRLMNVDGYLPTIEENIAELERYNAYLNESFQNQAGTDNWEELGPDDWNATTAWNPGVGRITGIDIDDNDIDHIIIGAMTGGVWRTVDGGDNWTPMGDYFSNLEVYSVVIDPADSNTYFFGSANGLIYKSTDSGATWNLLGDMGTSIVNKILIHPTDSNIMFATSQNGGIKKSTDGGANWSTAVTDSKGHDVEFKPGDPSVVYASGNGFHVSTNGGTSFTTIGGFGSYAKMIGVSADDASVVYVVEASGPPFSGFGAFYASNNSGASFTELNHTGNNYFGYEINQSGGQAPRDMGIAVSPIDANEVHIAGVLTYRSMNGGVSFEQSSEWIPQDAASMGIGYCHADVDLLYFYGSTMFVGTDGGIFKAEDTPILNAVYYTDITSGLGINQLYKIGISQTADVVISGGSQDNGTAFYTEAEDWKAWIGADGMETFIDKNDTDIMYGTAQFGQLFRTNDGGNFLSYLNEPGAGQGNWVTPFEQDPVNVNTVYLGYSNVYKSTNSGSSWVSISQSFGNLDHLKIAVSNNQVMYAAKENQMYRTGDGGSTNWATITPPGGDVNSIAIHPTDPNKVAVALNNVNRVRVTEDGGTTWIDYKFNLPSFSALSVVWDDNGADALYVGMNYGLFYIDNTFTEWQPYNSNLPNVIINELEINSVDNKIYAGTYGRGVWASPKGQPGLSTEDFISQNDVALYPNPANTTVTINLNKTVEADIRVFDLLGKLVIYQPDVSITNEHTLDIAELNNGIYFIRINSDIGTITKKLIKE